MRVSKVKPGENLSFLVVTTLVILVISLGIFVDSISVLKTPTGFSIFSDIYDAITGKSSPSLGPNEGDISVQATTYYIDYISGSDSNSGTSKASPWKRAPGMSGFSGSYSHSAGDRIIFKGGVTWPASTLPLAIRFSGSVTNYDYYGVDKTWYNGASFSRPVFDGENSKGLLLAMNYVDVKDTTSYTNDYIIVDGIEFIRASYPYIISLYNTKEIIFNDIYIHNWNNPLPASSSSDDSKAVLYNNYGTHRGSVTVQNSIINNFDGCSSHPGYSCGGCLYGIDVLLNNNLGYCAQALLHGGRIVAGNTIHDTKISFVQTVPGNPADYHDNTLFFSSAPVANGATQDQIDLYDNYYIYNNTLYNIDTSTGAFYINPSGGANFYVYNNLLYNLITPKGGMEIDGSWGTGNVYVYGNTFHSNTGATLIRGGVSGTGRVRINKLAIQNNHFITSGTSFTNEYVIDSTPQDHHLIQTPSQASAAGYTEVNKFRPTSSASPTVNNGISISCANCANLPLDILGTSRPQQGTWDIGAYEYSSSSVSSDKKQFILIGVDGVQVAHLNQMILNGKLPNFVRLAQNGGFMGNATITKHSSTETAPGNAELHTGLPSSVTGVSSNTCGVAITANVTTYERLRIYNSSISLGLLYGKTTCYIPDAILKNAKPIIPFWHNRTSYPQDQYTGVSANYADSRNVSRKSFEFLSANQNKSFYFVIYYGNPDGAGHAYGENSIQYNDSLVNVDQALGLLLDYLDQNNIKSQIILSADHGWNEDTTGHGTNAYDTVTIPLFSNNYSLVNKIYASSGLRQQCDIAPTILNYFGFNSSQYSDITSNGCGSLTNNLPVVNGVCGSMIDNCTLGTYLNITDNSTNYLWSCLGQNEGSNASCSYVKPTIINVVNGGNISITQFGAYVINISESGNYRLIGNVNAPSDAANSLYVNIDSNPGNDDITGSPYIWDIFPVTSGYQNRDISLRGPNGNFTYSEFNPKNWSLNIGLHTFYVNQRPGETGTQINSIQFIKISSSIQYHPADLNNNLAISLNEFTNYSSYFKLGRNWPIAPSPPDANYYSRAYYLLKRGVTEQGAYSYNASASCPSCFIVR